MTEQKISSAIEDAKARFVDELFEWLRIPSISTDVSYKQDVEKAATYIIDKLKALGADTTLFSTPGHPIVYAEYRSSNKDAPTILVYGHYDVQPADPYDLWHTPPFTPTLREDRIYARGACDDKGQAFIHVKAFELLKKQGTLPCHIKFLLEGEEEIGSPNLGPFLRNHTDLLASDAILVSDTAMISSHCPSVTVGVRGLCYLEMNLRGASRDMHSGEYGGVVDNPIHALSGMIAKLKNASGKIQVPHFYDDVAVLSKHERTNIQSIPFDENTFRQKLGAPILFGEEGYSFWERIGTRPALDVNGMWGGYTGEGAKTVLPAVAYAKLSARLVPNQNEATIYAQIEQYLQTLCPPTMKLTVRHHHGSAASVLSQTSSAYQAASKAMKHVWKKEPVAAFCGGSIPIVPLFEEVLGHAPVLLGFGLQEDSIHAPNESFSVHQFLKGIETVICFHQFFAQQ